MRTWTGISRAEKKESRIFNRSIVDWISNFSIYVDVRYVIVSVPVAHVPSVSQTGRAEDGICRYCTSTVSLAAN